MEHTPEGGPVESGEGSIGRKADRWSPRGENK